MTTRNPLEHFLFTSKINRMANPWLTFLSAWRKKNPKVSMKVAMKQAAKAYKKKPAKKKKSKK